MGVCVCVCVCVNMNNATNIQKHWIIQYIRINIYKNISIYEEVGGGGLLSKFSYKIKHAGSCTYVRNLQYLNWKKNWNVSGLEGAGRLCVFIMHKINEFWSQWIPLLPALCDRHFGTCHLNTRTSNRGFVSPRMVYEGIRTETKTATLTRFRVHFKNRY